MMRNRYISVLAAFFLFSASSVLAQQDTKREFSLKLTPLSYRFYFNDVYDPYSSNLILENRFEYPALGVFITDKNKHGHEVEFFNLYRRKEEVVFTYPGVPFSAPIQFRSTSFQGSYSFYFFFLKRKESPVKPFLGAGVELMYQKTRLLISNLDTGALPDYESYSEFFNTYAQLTPGVQYRPSKKFYLQLTFPVSWLVYGWHKRHIHHPVLTENQRHTTEAFRQIEAYIPARVGLRLSAGYVF